MGTVCCKNVTITDELTTMSLEEASETYIKAKNYEMALKVLRRSLELDLASYGDYSIHATTYLSKMALVYELMENPKEAIKTYEKVIEIFIENKTSEMPSLKNPYFSVGKLYHDQEKYKPAITFLETARLNSQYFIQQEVVHLYSVELYTAKTLSALYNYTEALTILENLLHKIKKIKGIKSLELSEVYESLADVYMRNEELMIHEGYQHNFDAKGIAMRMKLTKATEEDERLPHSSVYLDKAKEYLEQAWFIKNQLLGETSGEVARINIKLARFKTPEVAKKIILDNLKCLVNRYGENCAEVYDGFLALITSQMYITLYDDLKELFKPCLISMVAKFTEEYSRVAKYYITTGMVAYIQGRYFESRQDFSKALNISCKIFGENDPHVAECCEYLFVAALKDKKRKDASLNIKRAYQIVSNFYGKDHYKALKLQNSIAHHEKNHWSMTQEDFTERITRVDTVRSYIDLSVSLDDIQDYLLTDEQRIVVVNPLKDVALVGDLTAGSTQKKLGCEDCFLLMPDVAPECHFFAVIDGQGSEGKVAADDAKNHLSSFLKKHNSYVERIKNLNAAEKLLKVAMKNVECGLEKNPKISADSGCCVLGILINRNVVYSVNVGDCKAIIVNYQRSNKKLPNRSVRILVDQHRAANVTELRRVTDSGAILESSVSPRSFRQELTSMTSRGISPRVWRDGSGPGILSTRVLGNFKAKQIGIISDPEISCETLKDGDRYILAATDGLWDVMNEEDVACFIDNYIESQIEESSRGIGRAMTQALMQEAKKRWGMKENEAGIGDNFKVKSGSDDIAIVIAELQFF